MPGTALYVAGALFDLGGCVGEEMLSLPVWPVTLVYPFPVVWLQLPSCVDAQPLQPGKA